MRSGVAKYFFFVVAGIAALASWFYTLSLVRQLSLSEKQRVELWSEAYKEIQRVDVNEQISPIVLEIISSNNYIPVILCDNTGRIISYANLDSTRVDDSTYLYRQLEKMKVQHDPIVIEVGEDLNYYLYYRDSQVLTKLFYYPFIQFIVVIIFLIVVFLAAHSTKRAEEQMLWVAMSKETAHQLGTPLSSLMAWIEMLKISDVDERLIKEVEKDVVRLEKITERFSKIGFTPELEPVDLKKVIQDSVEYLKTRSPRRIEYKVNFVGDDKDFVVKMNAPLFEWVIENLAKNSIDAMNGAGEIEITVRSTEKDSIVIDFKDQGKGIGAKRLKNIFKPGYTTKKHGWGMGLALVKRIVQDYHGGDIFVLDSSSNGTTFRIILYR